MENGINFKKVLIIGAVFLLLFIGILCGLHFMESTFHNTEVPTEPEETKTFEKDEVSYFPRQDITTVLFIGVDEDGPVEEKSENSGSAYSDVVILLIFDETNKEINAITLNRDSMVDMTALDENGKRNRYFYGQLSFAHSLGNGLEESCENTVWAVSNLLSDAWIDYYVSMNMGAISIVNDVVGGVTVNVMDDFSEVGSSIQKGEYTLFGDEAETFVRSRMNLGDGLNISRMERQKEYIKGFTEALRAKLEGGDIFAMEVYEAVSDYVITDCSADSLASMLERYKDYELNDIVSPRGENVLGEKFYEFYIDEEDLESLVLKYLYAPK